MTTTWPALHPESASNVQKYTQDALEQTTSKLETIVQNERCGLSEDHFLFQKQLIGFVFLTKKSLKKMAAQDRWHFSHTGLQGLFLRAGKVGLVLFEQPHRPFCVCLTR